MASKQELELQVVDLSRKIKDLEDENKSLKISGVEGEATGVASQEDQKIILLLKEEIQSLKDQLGENLRVHAEELLGEQSLRLKAERLLKEEQSRPIAATLEVERELLAHELVEMVKYQYLPHDAKVAILKAG